MPPVSDSLSAPSQPALALAATSDAAEVSTADTSDSLPPVAPVSLPSAEVVRALARLLHEAELSEVAWEDASGDHPQKLVLRRTLLAGSAPFPLGENPGAWDGQALPSEVLVSVTAGAGGIEEVITAPQAPTLPALTVASPVVGIFQPYNPPLETGAVLKKGQILGYVESMRVPNEVRAPGAGVLSATLCLPGQGIEYGQSLFEISVEPQEVSS